jgi:hypothetical protein
MKLLMHMNEISCWRKFTDVKDTIKSPVKGPINSPGKNVNLPPKNREEVRIKCWGCICIIL